MAESRAAEFEATLVRRMQLLAEPAARWSLFLIYVWFGLLKVVDLSPANPLVAALLERTLPFLSFGTFIVGFGWFEVLIGALWLWPRWDRLTVGLFAAHMVMTALPLLLLPQVAWLEPLVPTLEGQYMIKNVALIALVIGIIARWRTPQK